MEKFSSNRNVYIGTSIVILFFFILSYFIFYFISLSVILIFGIILMRFSKTLQNFYQKVFKKLKFKESVNKIIVIFFVFFSLILFIFLLSESIADISHITQTSFKENVLLDYSNTFKEKYPKIFDTILKDIKSDNFVKKIQETVLSISKFVITDLFNFVFLSILIIPLMFSTYKSSKKNKVFEKFIDRFPNKTKPIIKNSLKGILGDLDNFLKAKINQIVLLSLIFSFGLFLIGVDGWFILGVFAGFINFIPIVGPLFGAIPILIFSFLLSPQLAVYSIIVILIGQLFDNFYIQPKLIPKLIKTNSLLVIVLTILGSTMFGAAGLILFLPLYLILRILVVETYQGLSKIYK